MLLCARRIYRTPASTAVRLLPAAPGILIDVAVVVGIHVAVGRFGRGGVAVRGTRARSLPACRVLHRGFRSLRGCLMLRGCASVGRGDCGASPGAVGIGALVGGRGGPGVWVVGRSGGGVAVGSGNRGGVRGCAGVGIIRGRSGGRSVGAVGRLRNAVCSGGRVVVSTAAVRGSTPVIRGICVADVVDPDVRRIVVAGTPSDDSPDRGSHHERSEIAGSRAGLYVAIGIHHLGYVGDVVNG